MITKKICIYVFVYVYIRKKHNFDVKEEMYNYKWGFYGGNAVKLLTQLYG